MVRIAICDSDIAKMEQIGKMVEECCQEDEIACEKKMFCKSQTLLYDIEDGEYYDILMLDIEMPNIDGLELGARVRNILPDVIIIFVTACEEYVFEAFIVQPYRFIPKRFMKEMLPSAIKGAIKLAQDLNKWFYVAENRKMLEKIPFKSIAYIWHHEKYAYIEKISGGHTKVRKTLKQIYDELTEDFAWMDRGCIVNLGQIQRITEENIRLLNGSSLGISKERAVKLKAVLRSYWAEKERINNI